MNLATQLRVTYTSYDATAVHTNWHDVYSPVTQCDLVNRVKPSRVAYTSTAPLFHITTMGWATD